MRKAGPGTNPGVSGLLDVCDGRAADIIATSGGPAGRGHGGHTASLALVAAYGTVPE